MSNELLLIFEMVLLYAGVLLFYRMFGKVGLFCWTAFATILANIEVLILVDAFTMEQTLGNVLFATTFLVTDILSENHGTKDAYKAVNVGIAASILFILISQLWLLYTPSANDWASPSFHTLFAAIPRITAASFVVYVISQRVDVWLYHKWWKFTENKFGNKSKFLWLRNNGSTLISQLVNSILYNVAAFAGTYDFKTMISIIIAGYVIFIVTSLCDTPAVYIARKMHNKYNLD